LCSKVQYIRIWSLFELTNTIYLRKKTYCIFIAENNLMNLKVSSYRRICTKEETTYCHKHGVTADGDRIGN
jgi:hypothetical protein